MKVALSNTKWQLLLLAAPLVLILAIAIATSGMSGAADAAYGGYGCGAYTPCDQAPPASYGLGNELLYVANGDASDVLVIDANTMRKVDTIPVPDADPGGDAWEIHGMVPSPDRTSVYAVGALSGTSADVTMYEIDTATKNVVRTIGPMYSSNVGYCGIEYDRNDENSNLIYATNMGTPLLGPSGSVGGWQEVDISTGTVGRYIPTDANGNGESSTCGVSWDAGGTHGYAGLMFDAPSSETSMDWPGATTLTYNASSGTPGISYHQSTVDKERGLLFQSGGNGHVLDVFDISGGNPVLIGTIDLAALTGVPSAEPHGPEISAANSDVLYVNTRQVPNPDPSGGTVLAIDVSDVNAPVLIGGYVGTNKSSCGVFADADKSLYYSHADPSGTGSETLLVANGNDSDVLVADVASMSWVDSINIPDADPAGNAWEIHGMIPSPDRTSVYAVGALSGTSADVTMYQVNSANDDVVRTIGPLYGSNVGYCGIEYDRNDESSNLVYATNMGTPLLGPVDSVGGWQEVDISTGTVGRFINTDANGNGESSTCGVAWDSSGTHGYAGLMFDAPSSETDMDWPGATTMNYNASSGTPGISYHQNTVAKDRGLLFQSGGTGGVLDVFDIGGGNPVLVGTIDLVALTGAPTTEPHGPEISSIDENILYVNVRQVPSPHPSGGSVLVIDVSDVTAPVLLGTIQGTNEGSCGVFAMSTASWNPGQPALSLNMDAVYWSSVADYNNRILSVDYTVSNAGPDAKDVTIAGTVDSGGVTSVNTPSLASDIASGGGHTYIVEYHVPVGVVVFTSTVYATAQSGATIYDYPGPYPGP